MIEQAQGLLSKSGSTIQALAGSHPIGLGIVIGVGAYYVINKFWLEDEEVTTDEEPESAEKASA